MLLREKYKVTVISRVKTGEKHIISWVINKLNILKFHVLNASHFLILFEGWHNT